MITGNGKELTGGLFKIITPTPDGNTFVNTTSDDEYDDALSVCHSFLIYAGVYEMMVVDVVRR